VSRAYVPGGINQYQTNISTLPNWTPTYAPEIVLDKEVGFKYDFSAGGVRGRLNVDYYQDDFTNIVEELTGNVGGITGYYFENAAAASLQGLEVQATIIPWRPLEISMGFSYNHAKYTKWVGSDPLNVAQPGQSICLPTSPAGNCLINLANNPFEDMPEEQGHITVLYHLPIDSTWGDATVSATVYAQSRVVFESDFARDVQILPSDYNAMSQAPYATVKLRAEWNDINRTGWNGAVFVDNLTNVVYANGKIQSPVTLGFGIANYAAPTMFGVEISRKFGGG
jgi:iron complex outermembrane receptor protein